MKKDNRQDMPQRTLAAPASGRSDQLVGTRDGDRLGTCRICRRPLDVSADPLSGDCGGDCWGCVGEIEANMFDPDDNPSREVVRKEIEWGWRRQDGSPLPPGDMPGLLS